jgi:hypothetical protein
MGCVISGCFMKTTEVDEVLDGFDHVRISVGEADQ